MIDAREFAQRLLECSDGVLPIGELEEWFASNSWNVHKQGDPALTAAVFEFEEIYSAYSDGRITGNQIREEMRRLANAILRPFAPKASPIEADSLTVYEIGRR